MTPNGHVDIEDLVVGQWVITSDSVGEHAKNGIDTCVSGMLAEITSTDMVDSAHGENRHTDACWVQIELRLRKTDGGVADITLLRPLSWLDTCGPERRTVRLSLEELGLKGIAEVLDVGECLILESVDNEYANRITGTIRHQNADVLDLVFAGRNEITAGVTAEHRFYSSDRDEWVPAGDLSIGERVKTVDGTARLVAATPREGQYTVFNIEVQYEHRYYVTDSGLLVHNAYTKNNFRDNLEKLLGQELASGDHAHHVLPKMFEERFKALDPSINIHDPIYGAPWEGTDHLRKAKEYNRRWADFFIEERSLSEVLNFAKNLSKIYGFEINF